MSNAERAKFEAWCDKHWGSLADRHKSATSGEWDAWQAGCAQQHRVGIAWVKEELKKLSELIEAQEREHLREHFDHVLADTDIEP